MKKAAPENDDQDGKVLPQIEPMLRKELDARDLGDGFAGGEPVGETGAHDAGEDGHGQPLPKEKSRSPASARSSLEISCSFE